MPLFLGLDCGTQSFKAVVIDTARALVVATESVVYARDLPEYGHEEGFIQNPDTAVRHADPRLWLAALDKLLERLRRAGVAMETIAGIGGAGQQHGSVYLNEKFPEIAGALTPELTLAEQLAPAFSRETAPIWMDASTAEECREYEAFAGASLIALTGSPATARFTGPQIRKFFKTEPEAYAATARIHLVSSFLCSMLIGADAPVDTGDGAGTNLMDVAAARWAADLVDFTAPGLGKKLPGIAARPEIAGGLSGYFEKYGLREGVPVATWTGDNPASLIGSGAIRPGIAVVSLGTSDTVFAATDGFRPDPQGAGHVFGNPAGGFMALVCFRNGSLARERVRAEAGVDREFFGVTAFDRTVPGNEGRLALPWFEPETTPPVDVAGLRANFNFAAAVPEVRIRAVIEAQALSMRLHTRGFGECAVLRVTGGASRNTGMLRVLSDFFGSTVETIAIPDSAALGAAMIAAHTTAGYAYETLAGDFAPAIATLAPRPAFRSVYDAAQGVLEQWADRSSYPSGRHILYQESND